MTCPTPEALLIARVRPEAFPDLVGHAARCPACHEAWEALAGVEDLSGLLGGAPPSESPVAGVLSGLAATPAPARARARVVFDSGRETAGARLRGASGPVRHLLLQAEPFELELALITEPDSARDALVGQLHSARGGDRVAGLADGAAAATGDATWLGAWCLLSGPEGVIQSDLAADGSFRFGSVGLGPHDLVIETPELQIVFPEFDLSAPGSRVAPA